MISLALSVVLCMGLTVLVKAETYDLNQTEATAYLRTLNQTPNVQYSDLEDLNGDGKPELIAACIQEFDYSAYRTLDLNIWTLQNGLAVKTATHSLSACAGAGINSVGIARSPEQIRLLEAGANHRINSEWYTFLNMDGTTEIHSGEPDPGDSDEIVSPLEVLSMNWETEDFFEGYGGDWFIVKESDVKNLLRDYAQQGFSTSLGNFTDVRADAYYIDAVKWAVDNGITSGTSDSTFSPDHTCTTAQILTFLWKANGAPQSANQNPFTDVSEEDYYYQAALWAAENGLVTGKLLEGNSPASRANTMMYLWTLEGKPEAVPADFSDVPANAAYAQAVAWAVQEGITSGTGNTTFSPDELCTRAQITTFLYQAFGK